MNICKKEYRSMLNNKLTMGYLIFMATALFSSCHGNEAKEVKDNPKSIAASANLDKADKYTIDTSESRVTYKGSMLFAAKGTHSGYVYLSGGELLVKKGALVGGAAIVDMHTITDIRDGSDNELVRHLKSADFFDVEKSPIAIFAINTVSPVRGDTIDIAGNLTIKGITHAITFPAKLQLKDGVLHASGKVTIDRTLWDVRYNSGKFFSDLADNVISDYIEFDMKIVAKKE